MFEIISGVLPENLGRGVRPAYQNPVKTKNLIPFLKDLKPLDLPCN